MHATSLLVVLTLDRAYSASGIQAVLALLQSSPLVDSVLDSGDEAVRFHYKGELYPGTLVFGKHWFDHVKRSDESARDLVRVVTEAVRISAHDRVTVYIDHRGDYRREVGPMSDQLRSIYEQVLRTGRTDGLPSSIRPTRLDLLEIVESSEKRCARRYAHDFRTRPVLRGPLSPSPARRRSGFRSRRGETGWRSGNMDLESTG